MRILFNRAQWGAQFREGGKHPQGNRSRCTDRREEATPALWSFPLDAALSWIQAAAVAAAAARCCNSCYKLGGTHIQGRCVAM